MGHKGTALGLFSLAYLSYLRHTRGRGTKPLAAAAWYAKPAPTFADAIATVRPLLWWQTVLKVSPAYGAL